MKRTINSYQDALDIREELAQKHTSGWHFLYRGHASSKYELLSSAGRKQPINGIWLDSERNCLNKFKELVKDENWQQFKIPSYNEDMFFMSIGRHLGLDCRLLDWTAKLETALYFAISDNNSIVEEGYLWVMCYLGSIDDSDANLAPFSINKLTLVKENFWSTNDTPLKEQPLGIARRYSQNGFFTITPTELLTTPLNELETDVISFIPIKISASAKVDILNHLRGYEEYLHLSTSSIIEEEIKIINSKYFTQRGSDPM